MARKSNHTLPKLTDPELDLLAHLEQGYQLETDSLGGNPVLRPWKDDEVIRPVSVPSKHHQSHERARADIARESATPAPVSCGVGKKAK